MRTLIYEIMLKSLDDDMMPFFSFVAWALRAETSVPVHHHFGRISAPFGRQFGTIGKELAHRIPS